MYENEAGPDLRMLCPTHGQPCVAKFEDDGVWYRAQVIGKYLHNYSGHTLVQKHFPVKCRTFHLSNIVIIVVQ